MTKRKNKIRSVRSDLEAPTQPDRPAGELSGRKHRPLTTSAKNKSSQISGPMFAAGTLGAVVLAVIIGYVVLFQDVEDQSQRQANNFGRQSLTSNDDQSLDPASQSMHGSQAIITNKKVTWDDLDDPSADGWDTEVFSDQVNAKLYELGKVLSQPTNEKFDALNSFVDSSFKCQLLRPESLNVVFEDQGLIVERAAGDPPLFNSAWFEGLPGLIEAVRKFREPFVEASDIRYKFKLFRVEPQSATDDEVVTRQFWAITGNTSSGAIEQNATWVMRWKTGSGHTPDREPQLLSIGIEEFEQVSTKRGPEPLFVDWTDAILGGTESYSQQLLHGYNYWLDRTETRPYWEQLSTPGIAIGDVNGDGLDDLYLCQERGLPNLLYLRNQDGTLADVSRQAGVDWIEDCRSALIIDLNNNGIQDLVVATTGGLIIAENDGNANFTVRTILKVTDDVKSICAADYDNDGRLDLYATVYNTNVFDDGTVENTSIAASLSSETIYDMNNGGRNLLFRNECQDDVWSFRDVTSEVGLDVSNTRLSLAASWEDFDNDGDQDLYVANDYGLNCLYRNDNGIFTEIGVETGTDDKNFSMSSSWADYNRDGLMDLYIGNMFSGAGNRITVQEMFKPGISDEERARFLRLARGNTLLKNNSDGTFDDVTIEAAVNVGRWAWSCNFVDLNNDGWSDLVVANGMITTEDTGDC